MTEQPITWTNDKRKLSDLIPWDLNPKQLTVKQAKHLEVSLRKFGFAIPLLISPDNDIYDGNQRKALMSLMGEYGPDAMIDVRVSSRLLTLDEQRELVVRIKENQADWDWDTLANLYEVEELGDWGMADWKIAEFMPVEEPPPEDAEPQTNRADELREQWGVELGQMWRLPSRVDGQEHRLICGDCTDFNDATGSIMLGDPPWDYSPESQAGLIDSFPGIVLWFGVFPCLQDVIRIVKKNIVYDIAWETVTLRIHPSPDRIGAMHKNIMVFSDKMPHLVFSGALPLGQGKLQSVVRASYGSDKEYKFQKPERLIRGLIGSYVGDNVYDPFCGSGTSIIACENLSRVCVAYEILPAYVAVSLQRYQDAFNITPELIQ